MDILVAEKSLVTERLDGERIPVRVSIGRPYKVADQTWSCPLRLEGLGTVSDGLGTDSWQALTAAIGVARQHLHHGLADGGRLVCAVDGREIALDDLFPQF